MTRPDPPRHRVPGAHLDGTASCTTVTTTTDRRRVVVALHNDLATALALSPKEAIELVTLLCMGRDGMVAVPDFSSRIYVVPAPGQVGQGHREDTVPMMLLCASMSALANATRFPCAGPGSVAIVHTSDQIADFHDAVFDVAASITPLPGR